MRFALAASFLSAVADRFGVWGACGQPHVAWGDFSHFTTYTGTLLSFLPGSLFPLIAWAATAAEMLFGIALIIGLRTRIVAILSGILLLSFALAMTFSSGVKAPLDFSVFSASAGAFLLSAFDRYPLSLDGTRPARRNSSHSLS
jgi:uncharacterized membrane protein YphA (DoxX/SURF4 family)